MKIYTHIFATGIILGGFGILLPFRQYGQWITISGVIFMYLSVLYYGIIVFKEGY